MIDKFLSIGFEYVAGPKHTTAGFSMEYKYHPDYLSPNHYTLIVFEHPKLIDLPTGKDLGKFSDYRLYIHDKDGKFVDSPFQQSDRGPWLEKAFNRVFESELVTLNRDQKLESLI